MSDKSLSRVIEAVNKLHSGYIFQHQPCINDIKKHTGLSRSVVSEAVSWLEQHRLIETEMWGNEKRITGKHFNTARKEDAWL